MFLEAMATTCTPGTFRAGRSSADGAMRAQPRTPIRTDSPDGAPRPGTASERAVVWLFTSSQEGSGDCAPPAGGPATLRAVDDLTALLSEHVSEEETVELCRALVQVPSENPPGD